MNNVKSALFNIFSQRQIAFLDLWIERIFFGSKIKFHSLHVWRYAKVAKKCLGPQIDPKYPVAIAGDFLEGPNVEAAFISGNKGADLIFDRLK